MDSVSVDVAKALGVRDGTDEAAARNVATTIVEIAAGDVFGTTGAPQAASRVKTPRLVMVTLMARCSSMANEVYFGCRLDEGAGTHRATRGGRLGDPANSRMEAIKAAASRWGPSMLMMSAIFALSAQPASALPALGWADLLVKKGGHVLGFGLLALTYLRGLRWRRERVSVAWLLAMAYAITDEAHQAYVAGRHPSVADILLFDSGGAAAALWVAYLRGACAP